MGTDVSSITKRSVGTLKKVLQSCLPDICFFCAEETQLIPGLCDSCIRALPKNSLFCPRCANPTSAPTFCPECLLDPPYFTTTISPFLYTDRAKSLVSSAKFYGDLRATASIGHLLGRYVSQVSDFLPDMLVPVPMHPSRLRKRGYNQAVEITRVLQHYVPVPMGTMVCQRRVATEAQSRLTSLALRRRNVAGAFVADEVPSDVHHIILVDDVMTTGSTLRAIAQCLIQAGISRVDNWVFSRSNNKI